jgi:hypothetical protein
MASQDIGKLFKTQIPGLEDAANIQEALRIYHYGANFDPQDDAAILPNSIAGHLRTLTEQLDDLEIQELVILNENTNLNDLTVQGRYSQNSTTDARLSGQNYPQINNQAFAGILSVVEAEEIIYQTYQTAEAPGNNVLFFRSKLPSSAWTPWVRLSDSTHTHDERYYTETEVNSFLSGKQNTITGAATSVISTDLPASVVVTSNSSGKLQGSSVTNTELARLSGVTSSVQEQLNNLDNRVTDTYTKSEVDSELSNKANSNLSNIGTTSAERLTARQNIGIFVRNPSLGNPPSPADGDLWFW